MAMERSVDESIPRTVEVVSMQIFPKRILRLLCLEDQRKVQFEDCVAEPLQTITDIFHVRNFGLDRVDRKFMWEDMSSRSVVGFTICDSVHAHVLWGQGQSAMRPHMWSCGAVGSTSTDQRCLASAWVARSSWTRRSDGNNGNDDVNNKGTMTWTTNTRPTSVLDSVDNARGLSAMTSMWHKEWTSLWWEPGQDQTSRRTWSPWPGEHQQPMCLSGLRSVGSSVLGFKLWQVGVEVLRVIIVVPCPEFRPQSIAIQKQLSLLIVQPRRGDSKEVRLKQTPLKPHDEALEHAQMQAMQRINRDRPNPTQSDGEKSGLLCLDIQVAVTKQFQSCESYLALLKAARQSITVVTAMAPHEKQSPRVLRPKSAPQSAGFPLQQNTQTQISRLLFWTMNTEDGHAKQDIQWVVRQSEKLKVRCGSRGSFLLSVQECFDIGYCDGTPCDANGNCCDCSTSGCERGSSFRQSSSILGG